MPGGGDAAPGWLTSPIVEVPDSAGDAVAALERLLAAARDSTGNVAVFARWEGDPGRSALASLTLSAEEGGDAACRHPDGPSRRHDHQPR